MRGLRVPTFHEQMRLLLERHGLSQKAAAKKLHVNFNQVSRWCSNQMPGSFEQLEHIARTFGVPWEWLLIGEGGFTRVQKWIDDGRPGMTRRENGAE